MQLRREAPAFVPVTAAATTPRRTCGDRTSREVPVVRPPPGLTLSGQRQRRTVAVAPPGLPSAGLFCPYCVRRETCAFHPPWRPVPSKEIEDLVLEVLCAGMADEGCTMLRSQSRRAMALPPPPAVPPPPPPAPSVDHEVGNAGRSGKMEAVSPARLEEDASTEYPDSAVASHCGGQSDEDDIAHDRHLAWGAPSWAKVASSYSLGVQGIADCQQRKGRWRQVPKRMPVILQRGDASAHRPR